MERESNEFVQVDLGTATPPLPLPVSVESETRPKTSFGDKFMKKTWETNLFGTVGYAWLSENRKFIIYSVWCVFVTNVALITTYLPITFPNASDWGAIRIWVQPMYDYLAAPIMAWSFGTAMGVIVFFLIMSTCFFRILPTVFGLEYIVISCGVLVGFTVTAVTLTIGMVLGELAVFVSGRKYALGWQELETSSIFYASVCKVMRKHRILILLCTRWCGVPGHIAALHFSLTGMTLRTACLGALGSIAKPIALAVAGSILRKQHSHFSPAETAFLLAFPISLTLLSIILGAILYKAAEQEVHKARQPTPTQTEGDVEALDLRQPHASPPSEELVVEPQDEMRKISDDISNFLMNNDDVGIQKTGEQLVALKQKGGRIASEAEGMISKLCRTSCKFRYSPASVPTGASATNQASSSANPTFTRPCLFTSDWKMLK